MSDRRPAAFSLTSQVFSRFALGAGVGVNEDDKGTAANYTPHFSSLTLNNQQQGNGIYGYELQSAKVHGVKQF